MAQMFPSDVQDMIERIAAAVDGLPLDEFIGGLEAAQAKRGSSEADYEVEMWIDLARLLRDFQRAVWMKRAVAVEAIRLYLKDREEERERRAAKGKEGGDGESPLSEQETEVLRLAATGRSNKEIAWEMGLAGQTVRHVMVAVHKKLGTGSRVEAVLWAVERGMVRV
jgi:DNA-binding CsgD family transcriptional regulator